MGDDRFERSSSFDPGEARRDTRLVLVQDGPVLMAIQIDEVLIRPGRGSTLTVDTVNGVVSHGRSIVSTGWPPANLVERRTRRKDCEMSPEFGLGVIDRAQFGVLSYLDPEGSV